MRLYLQWARLLAVAAGAAASLAVGTPADAAGRGSMPGLSDMTDRSTAVVRATCVRQESRLEATGIYTYSSWRVDVVLKGAAPADLEVRVPGGSVPIPGRTDGLLLTEAVDHAPRIRTGSDSFLFLWRPSAGPAAGGPYQVVGLRLGQVEVDADERVSLPWGHDFESDGDARRLDSQRLASRIRELAGRVQR
jgi:hypothetical protein